MYHDVEYHHDTHVHCDYHHDSHYNMHQVYKYVWCHNHGKMWLNTVTTKSNNWAWNLYYRGVDHTPHCWLRAAHRVLAMFSLRSNVESTTRPWQRADIASRFAQGSVACRAGLSKCAAHTPLARARECISMALRPWQPHMCTRHNNSGQSWVFWTCRRVHPLCPPG